MSQCNAMLSMKNGTLKCAKQVNHRPPHKPTREAIARLLPSGGSLTWTDPPRRRRG